MPRTRRPSKPPKVACTQCAREIPESAARTAEGRDYTLYFCGLDCSAKWKAAQARRGTGRTRRK